MAQASDELGRLAGAAIIGGFDGTELPAEYTARLARGHLGGVILFKRNITSVEQTWALCVAAGRTHTADAPPPFVSIDHEGGRVVRFGAPVTAFPPMRALGRADDVARSRAVGRAMGEELSALGFNLDYAPVCDVDSNPDNPVIGDRSFGREPERVSRHAVAVIEGLRDAGVMASAKHFHGHGDTAQDSHLALPRVQAPRARIDAVELAPFRAAIAARVATVMTAHVVFDALDPGVPATLSRAVVTGVLRGEMGYQGVVISDDLEMRAVADLMPIEEAAVRAVDAGCDAVLVCRDVEAQERARESLASRAGRDPAFEQRLREAAKRTLAARREAPPRPVREARELAKVLGREVHRALAASFAG